MSTYLVQFFNILYFVRTEINDCIFFFYQTEILLFIIVDCNFRPANDREEITTNNKWEWGNHTNQRPLSNASWYDGKQMLKTEISVKTATLTIENTMCTDTKNYTLVVSNGIGNTVTAMVNLIVNCKIFLSLHLLKSTCIIVIIVVKKISNFIDFSPLFKSVYCTFLCTHGIQNLYCH